MNTRDKALRKARKSRKESDWSSYKRLRNHCNNKIKKAKQNYHNDLLCENSNNPAKFWQCIKDIYPSNKSKNTSPPTTHDVEENTAKANALCEFFTNVAVSLKNRAFKLRDFVWETPKAEKMATNQKFGFKYVSRIFVEKELKSLKRKSAAGWDDLPPCMLKDCARVISGPLTHLINLSLTSGTVPNDWKIAKVTPIHKSGSIDDYNNFRPISVLPVLSKILERAVHTQFIQYIESNNILSKYQFGYRKKRST